MAPQENGAAKQTGRFDPSSWILFLVRFAITLFYATILGLVPAYAQPEQASKSYLGELVDEQSKQQADGETLRLQKAALQAKLQTDPLRALREEIQSCSAFAADVRRVRQDADKYTESYMARPLEWLAASADAKCAALIRDLKAKEKSVAKAKAAVQCEMEAIERAIAINTEMEQALERRIKDAREDRTLSIKAAEFDALVNATVRGDIENTKPTSTGKDKTEAPVKEQLKERKL